MKEDGIVVGWFQFIALFFATLVVPLHSSLAAETKGEYVLGPGDLIKITVFQNPDLAVETRVSEAGTITFPLIGQVQVGGKSTRAAEQSIEKLLRDGKFVLEPQVNILVTQVRGNQVAVLGHVTHPGRFPLEVANMKVSDALALAGGVTATGADGVVLVGTRNGAPFRKEIDLPSLFGAASSKNDVVVAAGDIIYVDRAPQFYIYGEVQKPGAYKLERDMTVMQALAQGGGVTPRGTERGLKLHRRDSGGKVEILEPRMDDKVRPDDVIYIRESLF